MKIENGKLSVDITEKQKKLIKLSLLTLISVVIYLIGAKEIGDPDAFWHIKTGEWILKNKQVPTMDIFSWYGKEQGLTWTNHEWLFEITLYLFYKFFGFKGVFFFVNIISIALFISLYKLCEIKSKDFILSLVIAVVSILAIRGILVPRPQIMSYLLFIIVAILYEKKKWFLALITTIITINFHGGVYPIFIILAIYYCYKEKPLMILLVCLSILLNPNGFELITYTIKNRSSDLGVRFISEAQLTSMAAGSNLLILIIYMCLPLILHKVEKIKLDTVIYIYAYIGLTFLAERHTVFAYVVVLPELSKYIGKGFENILEYINATALKKVEFKLNRHLLNLYLVILIFNLMLYVSIENIRIMPYIAEDCISEIYPKKAVEYLKSHPLDNLYHSYDYGGYLIFNEIDTFVDGRADPYSEKFNDTTVLRDYMESDSLNKDIEEFFDKYDIKNILLKKDDKLYFALKHSDRYKELYSDDDYVIWERIGE
ncbi:MAG: hypothetical protein QXG00_08155 [Candidatus Woesearchaeota archaeon]